MIAIPRPFCTRGRCSTSAYAQTRLRYSFNARNDKLCHNTSTSASRCPLPSCDIRPSRCIPHRQGYRRWQLHIRSGHLTNQFTGPSGITDAGDISAIGSVAYRSSLPTGGAGDLCIKRVRGNRPTDAELAQVCPWATAQLASILLACTIFRLALRFSDLRFFCHIFPLICGTACRALSRAPCPLRPFQPS